MHVALQALGCLEAGQSVGKLTSLSSVGAVSDSASSQLQELRLQIFDGTTQQNFLIDSGSVVSILPASKFRNNRNPDFLTLYAANSSEIATYDTITIKLNLNLRRDFT